MLKAHLGGLLSKEDRLVQAEQVRLMIQDITRWLDPVCSGLDSPIFRSARTVVRSVEMRMIGLN